MEEQQKLERQKADEWEWLEAIRKDEQKKFLQQQRELAEEAKQRDWKRRLVEKLPKLTDNDQLDTFLLRFEDQMREAEVEEEEWPIHLRTFLTGATLVAYTKDVPEEGKKDYWMLREALLDAVGLALHDCVNSFFFPGKKHSWSWQEAGRHIEFHLVHGCEILAEAKSRMGISRLLTWCSLECASFVCLQEPKFMTESARLIVEFEKLNGGSRPRRQRMSICKDPGRIIGMKVTLIRIIPTKASLGK